MLKYGLLIFECNIIGFLYLNDQSINNKITIFLMKNYLIYLFRHEYESKLKIYTFIEIMNKGDLLVIVTTHFIISLY